jgi:hypothetical protein
MQLHPCCYPIEEYSTTMVLLLLSLAPSWLTVILTIHVSCGHTSSAAAAATNVIQFLRAAPVAVTEALRVLLLLTPGQQPLAPAAIAGDTQFQQLTPVAVTAAPRCCCCCCKTLSTTTGSRCCHQPQGSMSWPPLLRQLCNCCCCFQETPGAADLISTAVTALCVCPAAHHTARS